MVQLYYQKNNELLANIIGQKYFVTIQTSPLLNTYKYSIKVFILEIKSPLHKEQSSY